MPNEFSVREAMPSDFDAMLRIFRAVVEPGDTYVFGPNMDDSSIRDYWFGPGISSFVGVEAGKVFGMYKLLANQRDRGSHVANAAFMVAPAAVKLWKSLGFAIVGTLPEAFRHERLELVDAYVMYLRL